MDPLLKDLAWYVNETASFFFFLQGISSKEYSPLHSGSEESHARPTQRSLAIPNKSRFLSQKNVTLSPSRKLFPSNLTPGEVRGLPQIPAESSRKIMFDLFLVHIIYN